MQDCFILLKKKIIFRYFLQKLCPHSLVLPFISQVYLRNVSRRLFLFLKMTFFKGCIWNLCKLKEILINLEYKNPVYPQFLNTYWPGGRKHADLVIESKQKVAIKAEDFIFHRQSQGRNSVI